MQKSKSNRREASQVCLKGCCPTPLLGLSEPRTSDSKPRSSLSESRRNFTATATSSIFPNTQFTNHESLPSLIQSYSEFTSVYPQYSETDRIDQIRGRDYFHLSLCNYTCLDYIGIGLFSYSQLHNSDKSNPSRDDEVGSTSSQVPRSDFPFFSISYKTGSLKTQLLHGGQESQLETSMKKRIMSFLNISETDYSMVFTANRTSAFKLLAESYPFQSSRKLLTVYDYESEAVEAMINSSEKRGAHVMSADFTWPRLRIHPLKLKKMVVRKKKKKKKRDKRGLFVFPVHSRVTGARYPYLWMNMAQENGWHVLLDACALGPKDMDSFVLSLFRPDFVVCSFYKVFGENPSGFGCLFVKKSTIPILDTSTSLGIVSLIPAIEKKLLHLPGESSDDISSNSFSGPIPIQMDLEISKSPELVEIEHEGPGHSATEPAQKPDDITKNGTDEKIEIKCNGLDHVEALGMMHIGNRGRCLINWLVNALMKLEHPNGEGARLIRIYGPKIKFDRGPALAFNVFDWKGEKVEPPLVQKLADRSNISLSYGFLHHIWFSDKYNEEKANVLEKRPKGIADGTRKEKADPVVMVVTLALSFLTNFEDVYKLWAFVAQFLDADFVEKERWRYTALNQKMVEV